MALHAHRRADPEQNALMTQHADEACRLIKELLASESSPKAIRKLSSPKALKKTTPSPQAAKIVSPRPTRATRQRVPAAPRKVAPVKSKMALNPKTPNSRTRTGS
jgi:separase